MGSKRYFSVERKLQEWSKDAHLRILKSTQGPNI